ncbi:RNA polymerase recycling motor ATPase HelR [Arthrobacter sp. 260]|uniref:RNA polymerase recycling motor ATPase HelR n=1 Tax=Arthrobacter sp. 260 TaxID=2735314 RepID=UPI0014927391|nr:RNA polymerase recycling motor ATPase HelR [Arthrobacter sp. 260]NOJ60691.1 AAA family ATPase [Arthrobacter sp. 260]
MSIFALSPPLSAKLDPSLISEDESHFERVRTSLAETLADLAARLEAERKAPGIKGQAALDRDEEIHRVSDRIRALTRFGLDLCLGRMVPADGVGPIYVGRFGLTDGSGRRLLIDWRSPAAEPFFGATHANPMGLASRRRYHWSRGLITDYWDEVYTADGLQSHGALDDQSAFIASLGRSRSGQMQDVLGTIQKDQDAIIRGGSRGALVVDGGPGTGKTVVALHRTAYLLYSDPRLSDRTVDGRSDVLFVGPHQPYLAYVADVLPSLGEEGVLTSTLRGLVPEGATALADADDVVARLKSSARMVHAIEPAVQFSERPPTHGMSIDTPWGEAWLGVADWEEAFAASDPGTPHNEARSEIWDSLVTILADKHEDGEVTPELLDPYLRQDGALGREFAAAWPVLDPGDLVADLWRVPAYLRLCAPWLSAEEVLLLQRSDAKAWTLSDLPLLDAARQRIGTAATATLKRAHAKSIASEREQMSMVVDNLIRADDDGTGLVTMLRQPDLEDGLIDGSGTPWKTPDRLAGPFAHVVVDEAQELTDAQWQMLLLRCPSRSFTIVGDRAQARHGFPESWPERLERIGLDRVRMTELSINYRTPAEIMDEAAPVIRAELPDANVPVSVRVGGLPVRRGRPADVGGIVDDWLAQYPVGTVCIIASGPVSVASGAVGRARDRVSVLTPETAKGLEFDLVVLVNPESFGEGIEGAVDRYVAMTRATQQLVLLTDDGLLS